MTKVSRKLVERFCIDQHASKMYYNFSQVYPLVYLWSLNLLVSRSPPHTHPKICKKKHTRHFNALTIAILLILVFIFKDVNEKPTDILLSTHTTNENLVQGSLLGNITMVDEDENTMTSCEILQDGQGRVSVNETMLIAGAISTNYEEDSSMILGISLKCCDQFGLCVTKNFSIEIKGM